MDSSSKKGAAWPEEYAEAIEIFGNDATDDINELQESLPQAGRSSRETGLIGWRKDKNRKIKKRSVLASAGALAPIRCGRSRRRKKEGY